jgi:hypothetical protein
VQFFDLNGDAYQDFPCCRVGNFAADGTGKSVKEGEKERDYYKQPGHVFLRFYAGAKLSFGVSATNSQKPSGGIVILTMAL